MSQLPVQQAFDLALQHHQAGRLRDAEHLYRQIISVAPDHVDAIHNLGVVALQFGRNDIASVILKRAVMLRPGFADAHGNLGNALMCLGQLDDAIAAYQLAISLRPLFPEALSNLSAALKGVGRLDDSVELCRKAILLMPDFPEAYNNLANSLTAQGHLEDAIAACLKAIELRPNFAEAHGNLGNALRARGQLEKAVAAYRQAIEINPGLVEAISNLGVVLKDLGQLDEAIELQHRAIGLRPGYAEAYNNLGNALLFCGETGQAITAYRQAVDIRPNFHAAHSNYVCSLHYHPAFDARSIARENHQWDIQHAQPVAGPVTAHANVPDVNRRLKIGYVSSDFRDHVVGRNMLPLFRQHDRAQFDIICYGQVPHADEMTRQFKQNCTIYRSIVGVSDDRVAEQIRADQIDVLVDLNLHTANNRLLVFARRPAPVQVSFAGYPASTGLTAIPYRLSDPYLDPPRQPVVGAVDSETNLPGETIIRLPNSFWCYDPLEHQGVQPGELPLLQNGFVTFGCLNNFCKVSEEVLNLWTEVLQQVRNSRLILLAKPGVHRKRTVDWFTGRGIASERIGFAPHQSRKNYLREYDRIDIGLDSFPYNGHTTSLDSLWMGVPVVSLVGPTSVSRAGLCQLCNLGLGELAADSPERFVDIAVQLAADPQRLKQLRAGLRERMERSPLMDAVGFARDVESAYRQMWTQYCHRVTGL